MRDSLSAYVVMIQVRHGLAPIPETSIMSYHMIDRKSKSLKTLEECRHDKPKALEWQDDGNPVQAPVAKRRLCGEVQPKPIFCRRTSNCRPP